MAIIPLASFRQLAFTMAAGLLIDTFLVRPVLTPAVLTLLGRAAGWPSRRIRTEPQSEEDLRAVALSGTEPDFGDLDGTGPGSRSDPALPAHR